MTAEFKFLTLFVAGNFEYTGGIDTLFKQGKQC